MIVEPAMSTCDIPASPATVHAAFTTPEGIRAWLAPHQYRVFDLIADVRKGGSYTARIGDDSGQETVTGHYMEISAGRRIVFTWSWPDLGAADVSQVEIRLAALAGGTRVQVRHGGAASEAQRQSRIRAWSSCLDKLTAWVAEQG